jgi:2-polyprenyl-3-methyl-5-hydroxy-6-metoxy-1,4-benzoquinol methylase
MYPWDLGGGVVTPLLARDLESVHRTRRDLMEGPVREALARAGSAAAGLDLACNEGWFSHRLLEWGAERVVGIDIRDLHIRRARLVRDHLGIDPSRLVLEEGDVFALDPERLGASTWC